MQYRLRPAWACARRECSTHNVPPRCSATQTLRNRKPGRSVGVARRDSPSPRIQLGNSAGGVDLVGGCRGDQQLAVALIGQQRFGISDREPAHLVDLVTRDEGTDAGYHDPVGPALGPSLAVRVLGVTNETDQLAFEPGLLSPLAQRALLEPFAGLELSLWERPVLSHRAVHDGNLSVARSRAAQHDPAGGAHDLAHRT